MCREGVDLLTHISVLSRFGHALSNETRTQVLLALKTEPRYPELADSLSVTRQKLSNHLACLRGCGLVVAVPDGRRTRYKLADTNRGRALEDLLAVVLAVDPTCCSNSAVDGCC
ncbi:ArsR family transcriptional regulator [Rhodococcus sp. PAMC28707]|uniref:ArsR/SmtB family transcription factor n=1 Tax=unclassified Rhodococcus (in: high G+C Gram-positive bacteria) TaxID=192944 RepID=UPI00109E2C75|nr:MULTISPECIES: metalloregulator ArsR/SmtB family transcription factor [unclassified Rhodococcus (in: high G+C Gram-positive bacteria)]QCB52035.1 ArsR family transcriptional regulator [Rhodococcus sp. PAMC28705]QCB59797.1 ArsR family transcriptional regulator [Rhodococcus sp. PAMC28707]